MTINNSNIFLTFLLCSYAVGWCINGFVAREKRMLDLCQFVRSFLMAPFALCLILVLLFLTYQFVVAVLIPHWEEVSCWAANLRSWNSSHRVFCLPICGSSSGKEGIWSGKAIL